VVARAHLTRETVEIVLEDLLSAVDLAPPGDFSTWTSMAKRLAAAADAISDTE
jgi:hypothetical protein